VSRFLTVTLVIASSDSGNQSAAARRPSPPCASKFTYAGHTRAGTWAGLESKRASDVPCSG